MGTAIFIRSRHHGSCELRGLGRAKWTSGEPLPLSPIRLSSTPWVTLLYSSFPGFLGSPIQDGGRDFRFTERLPPLIYLSIIFFSVLSVHFPEDILIRSKSEWGSDSGWADFGFFFSVDLNAKDMASKTALHMAILYKQGRSVELLLQAGADVSIADDSGDTPMHTAIRVGSLEIVEVSDWPVISREANIYFKASRKTYWGFISDIAWTRGRSEYLGSRRDFATALSSVHGQWRHL